MNTILEDQSQQTLTVRVVFDGAPYTGKTTAAYALSEALGGNAVTPAAEDGRTMWFDWMSYDAGQYEGQSIRVELVTVPGQTHLSERRRHLVEWGDVVVFMVDTGKDAFAASLAKFGELRNDLAHRDLPIVVVANKRDLADALPLDEIRTQLGLSDSDLLVEAIATSGGGIQEAFIFAVRSALENNATQREATSAHELLDNMQASQTAAALEPNVDSTIDDSPIDAIPTPDTAAIDDTTRSHTGGSEVGTEGDVPFAGRISTVERSVDATVLYGARLNPVGIAEGAAVVLLAEHWRMLVDVANGRSELSLVGTEEAAIALELATWGLILWESSRLEPLP